jgi:hypothetical protein
LASHDKSYDLSSMTRSLLGSDLVVVVERCRCYAHADRPATRRGLFGSAQRRLNSYCSSRTIHATVESIAVDTTRSDWRLDRLNPTNRDMGRLEVETRINNPFPKVGE